MRFGNPRIWIGLLSGGLVAWLFVLDLRHTSPGPVSRTHAQEGDLADGSRCELCHGERSRDMPRACGECHPLIAEDLAKGTGVHGTLPEELANDCGHCHTEHHGLDFPLVTTASFANAGIADRDAFDHAVLDFTLEGRHTELTCTDCHEHADAPLLEKGQKRFLGLARDCASCHEDVHRGEIVRDCASCHGQEHPFAVVAVFEHERFVAEGAHEGPGCTECHAKGSDHAVEVLAGVGPFPSDRACLDCHASPHREDFLAAVGARTEAALPASCESCHAAVHGDFAGHAEAMPAELHAASGFALATPHADVACAACHADTTGLDFASRYPGRTPDACEACHADAHEGQFATGPFAGLGCIGCHADDRFRPAAFDVEQHARTAFALEGSHAAVACAACHERLDADGVRQFSGTPSACAACHADAHRGRLVARAEAPSDCAECHTSTVFRDVASFDHGSSTSFALDGAHASASCAACHERRPRPDEAGRRFGFVHELFGTPVDACATCHADVHDGRFDRPGLPADVDGRSGCARCHATDSFDAVQPGTFDHERWSGYPLAEHHADVGCASCHVPTPQPDAHGRRFGRAPTSCGDCHTDPHVGQFREAGRTDCGACHLDAGGLSFDHDRDSRFPLDERHADLSCASCHVPWPLPGGGTAVRYKPLGTSCEDCHGPEVFRGGRR